MTATVRIQLSQLLKSRGITQRKLAAMANLRPATINQLCKGKVARIEFHTLSAICQALQVQVSDILVVEAFQPSANQINLH